MKFSFVINLSKKVRAVLILLLITAVLIPFCIWSNNDIVTTNIDYANAKVPKEFNGYRIVQVSDLHNKEFGKNQVRLLNKIKQLNCDMIAVTGDLVDHRRTNINVAMEFINGAVKIAPVYYIIGNHEVWTQEYYKLYEQLQNAGVTILSDTMIKIEKNGSYFNLAGYQDPDLDVLDRTFTPYLRLQNLLLEKDDAFTILLSHRPELFYKYVEYHVDLVFTGHAHGGQVRLPLIGGLLAPNQGWFPKYTSGIYQTDGTTMILSRGLGNSSFPVRIFNRPEIICTTLKSQ